MGYAANRVCRPSTTTTKRSLRSRRSRATGSSRNATSPLTTASATTRNSGPAHLVHRRRWRVARGRNFTGASLTSAPQGSSSGIRRTPSGTIARACSSTEASAKAPMRGTRVSCCETLGRSSTSKGIDRDVASDTDLRRHGNRIRASRSIYLLVGDVRETDSVKCAD